MPNIVTKEEQELYETLQDLWDRTESVDDVFEELSGYINGIRSAQSQPVPEWQQIDTAPKDGSAILAWAEGTTTTVYWHEVLESWELCHCGAFAESGQFWPQYWMPLPAAPTRGGDNE